ncbi:acetylcholinesterase [Xylariaceae sp. FL0255]|nr:acetylcholinesterase [Xylariaceae sp. FL0255]
MLFSQFLHVALALAAAFHLPANASPVGAANELPVVDLGYALFQAVDTTEPVYSFTNIRYATAPRFSKPIYPPPTNRSQINNGTVQSTCPQAYPAWEYAAIDYLNGDEDLTNYTTAELEDPSLVPGIVYYDEDCLHLDIQVPQDFYDNHSTSDNSSLLPIVVWIHGGGFVQGDKSTDGNGTGLITRAKQLGSDGIMFVAINYRLGMFGWLPAETPDDTANLGLHDISTALQWVQDYAHLFGGDANQVTILSESAGCGVAISLLATWCEEEPIPLPFHQVVLQSPWTGLGSNNTWRTSYQKVFQTANASTLDQLRQLDTKTAQGVNYDVVTSSPYGSFTFSPVFNWTSLTSRSDNVSFVVGSNSAEGVLFAAPNTKDEDDYLNAIQAIVPDVSYDILQELTDELYPSEDFDNQLDRLRITLADLTIHCNAYKVLSAYPHSSYDYQYAIGDGLHSSDLWYTFYDNDPDTLPEENITVAEVFQGYLVSFFLGDSPPVAGVQGLPVLPLWAGNEAINYTTSGIILEPAAWINGTICDKWSQVL